MREMILQTQASECNQSIQWAKVGQFLKIGIRAETKNLGERTVMLKCRHHVIQ
jgi:hypothetical protein